MTRPADVTAWADQLGAMVRDRWDTAGISVYDEPAVRAAALTVEVLFDVLLRAETVDEALAATFGLYVALADHLGR